MKIQIEIGLMAPPIFEQLKAQGLRLDDADIAYYERLMMAASLLRIKGMSSDSESNKISHRIVKDLCKHVVRAVPEDGGS